jgi:hypothetical protein
MNSASPQTGLMAMAVAFGSRGGGGSSPGGWRWDGTWETGAAGTGYKH